MNDGGNTGKVITFKYSFVFDKDRRMEFTVRLDEQTLRALPEENRRHPEWTRLEKFRCPNCPLDDSEHKFCPVAANIADLIERFKEWLSYEEVDLSIETEERDYLKRTTLQEALSSLIGVYMVTSGCPVLEKLKPMARYHLPLASASETAYRTVTMYLLAQYFLRKRGRHPDWELKNLAKVYQDIQIINGNFGDKLREVTIKDASLNALVKLNCFANYISFQLDADVLRETERYFNAYFE